MKVKRKTKKKKVMDSKMVKHHIINRCRGGSNDDSNLIRLFRWKEKKFHELFGDKSFVEAARLLLRTERIKTGVRYKITIEEGL